MRFVNPIPFVRDIDCSRDFYQKTLGLRILQNFGNFVLFEGGFAIHEGSSLEETAWGAASIVTEPYGRKNLLLYFEDDDVDAAFRKIAPHVELIHPVVRQAWGQRVFRFYDPDGHAVEIGEPQDLGQPLMKTITAEDLDKKFDDGEDISDHLDWSKARRPNQAIMHVGLDLPAQVLTSLDEEAKRLGVSRQSLLQLWIEERLATSQNG